MIGAKLVPKIINMSRSNARKKNICQSIIAYNWRRRRFHSQNSGIRTWFRRIDSSMNKRNEIIGFNWMFIQNNWNRNGKFFATTQYLSGSIGLPLFSEALSVLLDVRAFLCGFFLCRTFFSVLDGAILGGTSHTDPTESACSIICDLASLSAHILSKYVPCFRISSSISLGSMSRMLKKKTRKWWVGAIDFRKVTTCREDILHKCTHFLRCQKGGKNDIYRMKLQLAFCSLHHLQINVIKIRIQLTLYQW